MRKKLKIYVIGAGNYTSSYTRFFRIGILNELKR